MIYFFSIIFFKKNKLFRNNFNWLYLINILQNVISCRKHEIDIRELFISVHAVCILGFFRTVKNFFWIILITIWMLLIAGWLLIFISVFGRSLVCFFGKNGVVYCPKVSKSVIDFFEKIKMGFLNNGGLNCYCEFDAFNNFVIFF